MTTCAHPHSGLICVPQLTIIYVPSVAQNGGSVRGYRELLGPLTISAKVKPFGSHAVSLCIGSAERRCALLAPLYVKRLPGLVF
jgi:hypothetical protein